MELKEENLFTNAWKYLITGSNGRSVLMTLSTGPRLAAGFLKLRRAHWSACQPWGQNWDETDKIIVFNETQISRSVWIRASWALFSFFFFCLVFVSILILNLKRDCGSQSIIQTRAQAPALVELWYRLKFCKRARHRQPAGPRRHDYPNYLPLRPSFYTGRGPLCSLCICISLGQMLKVREWTKITHNLNATEKSYACVRKGDSLLHICSLTGFSIAKHSVTYTVKYMFSRPVETPALCNTFSRLQ